MCSRSTLLVLAVQAVGSASHVIRGTAASRAHAHDEIYRRQDAGADRYANWPTYDQLPLNSSYPTKAAWDVWGSNDTLGALNHITNATILAASRSEIKLGEAYNLNLELDTPDPPINPSRRQLNHLFQPASGYTDDVLVMNTQISTQFDGLRHFPYSIDGNQTTYQFYNDLIDDYGEEVIGATPTLVLGIQESAQYGIAGRGVLLDFATWANQTQNLTIDCFTNYSISVSQLEAVAQWQGLDPKNFTCPGDMLFVRTGWVAQYNALPTYNQSILPYGSGDQIGILASDETLAWLWEKKLALVGADNPAFESVPFDKIIGGEPRSLHQVFIGGWGQSIVEFLDFERLAPRLRGLGRSSFFLTIQTLNVVSGIASPPNALAII